MNSLQNSNFLSGKRVFVAGHSGMAGKAIVRRLDPEACEILTIPHRNLDLTNQEATGRYITEARPDIVIVAAARVGGIVANDSYPVEFLADNLAIELNLVQSSYKAGVKKLLFLGSNCIYPKFAPQPVKESSLLTGELEPTNQWYAVAKIAGVKLCDAYSRQYGVDYFSVMPTNLFGPGDNYHPENSHVIAGLIRRIHEAMCANSPTVTVWGTGTPRREFLYVDDLADACVFVLKNYTAGGLVNIGAGHDITIAELASMICDVVGFRGKIVYDSTKPDGTPRKLVDTSRMTTLGWIARTPFREGLEYAYRDFLEGNRRER
jgi:GDP-L-fucose synthase